MQSANGCPPLPLPQSEGGGGRIEKLQKVCGGVAKQKDGGRLRDAKRVWGEDGKLREPHLERGCAVERRISPQLQQPYGGEGEEKRKKSKKSCSCAPGDGVRSTRRPGSSPGRGAGRSPRPRSPAPRRPGESPPVSAVCWLANDRHLHLLIRSAWRCWRLSARPPSPPPSPLRRETTPFGAPLLLPPREPPSRTHLHREGGGQPPQKNPFPILPKPATPFRHRA